MFLPDVETKELVQFSGPNLRVDPLTVPEQNALNARNVAYVRGQVATRYGHTTQLTPGDAVTALYNWLLLYLGANHNWLVWYSTGVGVRYVDLDNIGGGVSTLIAQTTAQGTCFVGAGSRLYVSYYNATGVGIGGPSTSAGSVYSWAYSGADPLFAGPITTGFLSMTEPAAGVITAGTHRFGYLLQTRNGFTTTWCPVTSAGVFAPIVFVNSGLKNLRISITATWPSYALSLQLIMTTTANLNRYYIVPGATISVPAGVSFTVQFPDVSIDDTDLAAETDAAIYAGRLTNDVNGNAPFLISTMHTYSSRMAYVTRDGAGFPVCYYSNADDYQALSAATSGVYLPGNLQITVGISLRGVDYLFGPHWTYSVADNGNLPTQWAKPQAVDNAIGTLSPQGVYANASQGFVWVCDVAGLYLFQGGNYPSKPISYYQQSDWNRINWSVPTCVQVVDDTTNKRVVVQAALDAATTPSHQLTWDYTDGVTPEEAKYSLNNMASYAPGALAIVQTPATKHQEVWVAPSSAGAFVKENEGIESHPYRDVNTAGDTAVAISSLYETSLLPGLNAQRGQMHFHHGAHLRVRGSGSLALKVWGLDHLRSTVPAASPMAISTNPGLEYLFRYFLQSEYSSIELSTNAVDTFFILSGLKAYYTLASPQR